MIITLLTAGTTTGGHLAELLGKVYITVTLTKKSVIGVISIISGVSSKFTQHQYRECLFPKLPQILKNK